MSLQALEELAAKDPRTAWATSLEVLRRRYDESLYDFAKYGLKYPDLCRRTHRPMIETLESPRDRKLIVMPRGSLKTTVGVVSYALWRLTKNPNLRILLDGETQGNTKNLLREMKAQMASPLFIALYGDWRGPPKSGEPEKWTETECTIAARTRFKKEATITCAGVGVVKVGQHYDIIIGDDYNSRKNSMTPEQRAKVVNHYKMNTAILDPGGEYVIIGTRYAADDVIGHILVNECGLTENGEVPPAAPEGLEDQVKGLL